MGKKIIVREEDALGVIDPQVDFVNPSGALYVKGVLGESSNKVIILRTKKLIGRSPFVFFTEDRHPEGHIEFDKYGQHAVQGTLGQRCISELLDAYQRADDIVKKGSSIYVVGLSVSTSPDFPGHLSLLRAKKIKRIFLGAGHTRIASAIAPPRISSKDSTYTSSGIALAASLLPTAIMFGWSAF